VWRLFGINPGFFIPGCYVGKGRETLSHNTKAAPEKAAILVYDINVPRFNGGTVEVMTGGVDFPYVIIL
jgi:hypothetical protein